LLFVKAGSGILHV